MLSYMFRKEYYDCSSCDEQFTTDELDYSVELEWYCPKCKDNLDIFALDNDEKLVVQRKYPEDLVLGDRIYVVGYGYHGIHELKNKNKIKKGYALSLLEHGRLEVTKDQWLNIHEGTWDPNDTSIDINI